MNLGKKKFWEEVKNSIVGSDETNLQKSLSVAFGFFIGIVPIWGFQLAVGIPIAILLRLNVAIVVASANISFPPMNIFIMYLSYKFGAYFVSNPSYDLVLNFNLTHKDFVSYLFQFIIGGTLLALLSAVVTGIITFAVLSAFRKNPSVTKQSIPAE